MKWKLCFLLAFVAGSTLAVQAQAPSRFAAYEHCKFADDLALVENTTLASGVQGRTVKTIMGPKQVPLAGGKTLVYGYPQTEPFATVKVEQIPAADYPQARQDLIANFEQILTGDDSSTRNYTLKPRMNNLEIYGLDRKALEGGVLGIYVFFVDRTHTATTIYFLNQDPSVRSFQNLTDYAGLRDTFLNAYTSCAAGVQRGRTATTAHAEPTTPVAAPAAAITPAGTALPEAPGVPSSAAPSVTNTSSPSRSAADTEPPMAPPEAAPLVRRAPAKTAAPKPTARKPLTAAERKAAAHKVTPKKAAASSTRNTAKAPLSKAPKPPLRKKK